MYYTKSMCDLLRSLGEDATAYFSHYLDNYFYKYEEPDFSYSSYDLKRIWFELLVDGLCAEIRRNGKNRKAAMIQLRKLLNYNSKWYENKNFVLKTVAKAETIYRTAG